MAGTDRHNQFGSDELPDPITELRIVAEKHLQAIDEEMQLEQRDELKRQQDLEHHAKRRRRSKEKKMITSSSAPTPRMRSAQDVLNRLLWDNDLDISTYVIGYLERFTGIKETSASNWVSEVTEEDWIPQHRIKYFKRIREDGAGEIVWDRERRIDKIFGTGMNSPADFDAESEAGGVELPL